MRRYEQILIGIGVFEGDGSASAKFSRRRGRPPTFILRVAKQEEWTFYMVWKFWQKFLSFYHNSRVWQTDGGTEILLMANTALHSMERGKTMTQVYKNNYKKRLQVTDCKFQSYQLWNG